MHAVSVVVELFGRYAHALARDRWCWLVAVAFVGALVAPPSRRFVARRPRLARTIFLASIIALGCVWAWSLVWASDDAYISFRYADNWAHGRGLVFNPGERVEGYTDFLWTVMIGCAIRLGADPGQTAIFLSLASFVALILLVVRLTERLSPVPVMPLLIGPALVAANYTVASFATAGLETVFATALVVLALERAQAERPLVAGVAGILATLAHPDHAIFYAALGGALLLQRRGRELLRYLVPLFTLFIPYFLWRWSYYGDLMPNTYYAKSADKAYYSQGFLYLAVSALSAGLWSVLPLAIYGIKETRRSVAARAALISLPVYLLYVAKIGGDFMLGRLITPVLAIAFVFADVGLHVLLSRGRSVIAGCLGALAATAAVPAVIVGPGDIFRGIADERTFTPVKRFSPLVVAAQGYDLGHALERKIAKQGVHPKVAVFSLGMASYYTTLPVFDLRGLTSKSVAHLPIRVRGRPGHEKGASLGHLLEAGVELSESSFYPPPYETLSRTRVAGVNFYLARYDPEFVSAVQHSLKIPNFPLRIDKTMKSFATKAPERVACDLWHMKEYYFSRNDDRKRRAEVTEAAVQADETLGGVRKLLLETGDPSVLGYQRLHAFSFEPGERWTPQNTARQWPRAAVLPEQSLPFGNTNQFLNTFTARRRDGARGVLSSPPFVIVGDVITFKIGGGFDPENLRVALVVDGTDVRGATGCNSEWLDRRAWDVRAFRGKTAQVVVTDHATAGWGHLLLDDVVEWRAPQERSGR